MEPDPPCYLLSVIITQPPLGNQGQEREPTSYGQSKTSDIVEGPGGGKSD